MLDLLKLLQILGISLLAQIWFNFFNFKFWLSGLKSGIYHMPILGWFKSWWTFTLGAWCFNAIFCYIWATMLIGWCYKLSVESSGGLTRGFLVIQAASFLSSIYFIRLIVGETPNRNGWIAIILILLALPFAANSSK